MSEYLGKAAPWALFGILLWVAGMGIIATLRSCGEPQHDGQHHLIEVNDSLNALNDSLLIRIHNLQDDLQGSDSVITKIEIRYKYIHDKHQDIRDSDLLDSFNAVVDRYQPRAE